MVSNMVTAAGVHRFGSAFGFRSLMRMKAVQRPSKRWLWRWHCNFAETSENFIPLCGQFPKADPAYGKCDQNVAVTIITESWYCRLCYEGKPKIIRTLVFPGLNKYVIFLHSLLPFRCTWSSGRQACVFPPRTRFSAGRATICAPLPARLCP